jgi:Glycosyl transferase family 2
MAVRTLVWVGCALVAAFAAIGATDDLHRRIPLFLSLYGVAFAAYAIAVRSVLRSPRATRRALITMAMVAVAARVAVLPARPDLSTDAYRYVWEGRVVLHGANPFAVAPADSSLAALRDDDFELINHKPLATIYPSLAQALFAVGAWIAPNVIALKSIFTLLDLGTALVLLALLRARGRPATHALVYAWSPLVILETGHSGHLDAAGVFFLVVGVTLVTGKRRVWGAVVLGASFLVKYLAIALVPFFGKRGYRRVIPIMVVTVVVGYLPFLGAGNELTGSLRTYGFDWSFNGPPFMALSALFGDAARARLVLVVLGGLFAVVAALRTDDLARYAFLVIGAAILLSPTVYPWYLVWLVPFLCVSPNRAWIVFTGLVALSYWVWVEYDASGAWMVPNGLLMLEYAPFYGLLLWDVTHERRAAGPVTDYPGRQSTALSRGGPVGDTRGGTPRGESGVLRVSVVIPARNEESAIGLVLDEIPRDLVDEVIVVDNGSADRTAEVARAHGATVVHEPTPGYGGACLAGLARVAAPSNVVVILDADRSDYPEDLPRLLEPIASGEVDMVIGSRTLGGAEPGALPWNQRFGNRLACGLMRLLYDVHPTDMGPFRAIRRESLERLGMQDRTFGWNVEMHAKAVIAGLAIQEVPVRYRRRVGTSKISGTVSGTIRAGTKIIGTILVYYPRYLATRRERSE